MGTGKTYSTKYLLDSNNNSGAAGQVLSTTSTGINWVDANTVPGTGLWLADGNNIYNSNSGNVGIGTTSPSYNLVVGDGTTDTESRFYHNDASYTSIRGYGLFMSRVNSYIRPTADGTQNLIIGKDNATWNNIELDVNLFTIKKDGTERMRIDSSGNVGIGTTSPSDGDLTINTPKLHVVGPDTPGAYNLAARFQAGNDSDNTGSAILINHSNDRGLLIKAGRKDSDREVAYFDVISSGGNITNMLTMGKFGSDYNVGIGTTSPSNKLHVNSGTTNEVARFESTDGTAYLSIMDNNTSYSLQGIGSAGDNLTFYSNNAERMRITGGGNVGIGTGSPDSKLHIEDTLGANIILNSNTGAVNNGIYMTEGTSSVPMQVGAYLYYNGSTNKFNIATGVGVPTDKLTILRDSGNVGIGTTSPSELLELKENGNNDAKISILKSDGNEKALIGYDNGNGGLLKLYDESGTTNVFVRGYGNSYFNNGNVGIGTTSPSQILTVRKDSSTTYSSGTTSENTGDIVLQNNNQTDDNFNRISFQSTSSNNQTGDLLDAARITAIYSDHGGANPSGELAFETKADAGTMSEIMRINKDGRVGIGTASPDQTLDVFSSDAAIAKFTRDLDTDVSLAVSADNSGTILSTLGVHNYRVFTNNAERMRIDSSGKVGIGTTVPSYKLSVTSGADMVANFNSTNSKSSILITDDDTSGWLGVEDSVMFMGGSSSGTASINIVTGMVNTGNVGIGTASPSSKLHIKQSVDTIDGGLTWESVDGTHEWSIDANNAGNFRIYKGTTAIARFDSSGNVGIGTTSPGDYDVSDNPILAVGNTATTNYSSQISVLSGSSGFGYLLFGDGETGNEAYRGQVRYDHTNDSLEFVTAGSERMQITSGGDVGIGTTPHAVGDTWRSFFVGSSAGIISRQAASGTDAIFSNNYYINSSNEDKRITTGGASRIFINQDVMRFQRSASGNTDTTISWSESMRISSDGYLGIGTTLPVNPLHVEGNFTLRGNQYMGDDEKLILGLGEDLQIYHNGSDSVIESDTGDLYITNKADGRDIFFRCDDGSGGYTTYFFLAGAGTNVNFQKDAIFVDDVKANFGTAGDLKIYHDGTDSVIQNETGDLELQNRQNDGDIKFKSDDGSGGVAEYFRLDGGLVNGTSTLGATVFPDKSKIFMGSGNDLRIYHNGTDSAFENVNGHLYIQNYADDKDIIFQSDDGSGGIATYFLLDGSIAPGTGAIFTRFPDNSRAVFGTASDLQIYHDGSNSYIEDIGSGNLFIRASANAQIEDANGENMAIFKQDDAVELYYDGNKKLETTNDGVLVSGFLESKKADTGNGYNDGIARFVNETTATSGGAAVINVRNTYGVGFGGLIKFWSTSTATSIGNISFNSSRTAVNYNTGSDYRLKEDYRDFNGLNIISDIDVYDFKWKNQDDRSYGVIAHELDQVVPGAVTGEKDAEDMQCVDYSKLVPVLIKSIQELEARLAALEN